MNYTIQPGDTLTAIADHFGINMETIMTVNGIVDPNVIYAGQTLEIPNASGSVSHAVLNLSAPASVPAVVQETTPALVSQPGTSLWQNKLFWFGLGGAVLFWFWWRSRK